MNLKQFFSEDESESVVVGEVKCEIRNRRTGEIKYVEMVPVYANQIKQGSSLKHKIMNRLKLWR